MLIELDLNMNDAESLLRHCVDFQPASGDCREDSRLSEALASLGSAIEDSMNTRHSESESIHSADSNCSLYQTDLVRNLTKFGKGNPTPTLWIYAENDPFFSPDLVGRMIAGYRSAGGNAELALLPPFGRDGHSLYKQEANTLLKPHIEDFLRSNLLPAMDDSALMLLLSKLAPEDRASAEAYLQSVTEKAMAMSKESSSIYWYYGARSLKTARKQALSNCRKATGKPCQLVAQNMELIDGWQDVVSPSEK